MSTCSLGEDTICLSVPSYKKFHIEGEIQMAMDSLEEFTENRAARIPFSCLCVKRRHGESFE